MTERRYNWKAHVSEVAMQRSKRRQELIIELDRIREKLSKISVYSPEWNTLMAERAELRAKLATI